MPETPVVSGLMGGVGLFLLGPWTATEGQLQAPIRRRFLPTGIENLTSR